ncbi:MAG: phosphatidylserine decarboxylase, partial [Nitrospirota bacterium]|nr:phosphatidylserine decarboxylase [Nitrospirota bacterium]
MKPCTGVIAVEAYPFLIPLAALLVVFYFLGWGILGGITLLLFLFVTYFFRNPERTIPTGEGLVVSPADGKVIVIKEVFEDQYLKKNMLQISIFLNVFNVHIQRVPISGEVKEVRYHPGKFLAAWDDKASLDNEQVGLVLDTGRHQILSKQIAGLIAR